MYNKKVLSTAKKELNKAKAPKKPNDIITDPMGQWNHPGLNTRIPGNGSKDINITMNGVYKPLLAIADTGEKKKLYPGDNHTFRGAKYVDEFPEAKKGGERKRRKTKSLSGTNKLMLKNPLFEDYKNRVYDPNVDYFQKGGVKGNWKVREKLYDGEDAYFKANPHVGGMAAEDDTVILNPYSKLSKAEKEAIIQNEKARLTMRNGYARPNFDLTEEQAKAFENYSPDIQDQRETVVGRILSGDPSQGKITKQQKQYAEELKRFMDMHKDTVLTNTSGPRNFQKGGVSSLEGDLISKVIMERNKDKDFVQRAYALGENPGTPMFNVFEPNEFGQTMSHKMAWGEDEKGQTWMFPTVLNPKNEAIKVPNQYADYISNEGYKRATGMIPKHEYIEAELTDDEIEEYRKGGYIVEDISVPELNQAQKGGESKVILTKEHTDKKGNKTIVVTKDDGTKYTKVISKDGKVYNNTQAGLSPEMKEYYKKKADWENKSSGVAQPVDDFWTLPIGMTSAGVKGAVGLAKGLTSLGRNAAKSSLVQAGKAGLKKSLIKSLPGSSINNLVGSGFAGSALTDVVTGKVAEPWKKANKSGKGSDYIDAVSENMLTALDAYPLYNTASKGLKHLAKLDKMHLPLENTHSILPEGMYRSGIGGMDMSRYEVKNPDFYTQMLNTYSNKVLSPTNKKFYSNLIETIKKQNGLVTERQYNELQRLKSGNFNFGKKAYKAGGIVVDLTEKEIQDYIKQGYIVEDVE